MPPNKFLLEFLAAARRPRLAILLTPVAPALLLLVADAPHSLIYCSLGRHCPKVKLRLLPQTPASLRCAAIESHAGGRLSRARCMTPMPSQSVLEAMLTLGQVASKSALRSTASSDSHFTTFSPTSPQIQLRRQQWKPYQLIPTFSVHRTSQFNDIHPYVFASYSIPSSHLFRQTPYPI